ncbi:hypothetical protein V8E55_001282 [Tylopilus felleus]
MNLTYIGTLATISFIVTAWRCVNAWYSEEPTSAKPPNYSYRGYDYPLELHFDISDSLVVMTLHETIHFPPNWSEPFGELEWDRLVMAPNLKEDGRTRLGLDYRLFTMVFWHHFHCLWSI